MKVSIDFQPITITIQNLEELKAMRFAMEVGYGNLNSDGRHVLRELGAYLKSVEEKYDASAWDDVQK